MRVLGRESPHFVQTHLQLSAKADQFFFDAKMKFLIFSMFALASASALPQNYNQNQNEAKKYNYKTADELPTIISYENNNDGTGPYSFSYQTSDGSGRQESAQFADPNNPDSGLIVTGSYTYKGPEGEIVAVHYIADQLGYRIVEQ